MLSAGLAVLYFFLVGEHHHTANRRCSGLSRTASSWQAARTLRHTRRWWTRSGQHRTGGGRGSLCRASS